MDSELGRTLLRFHVELPPLRARRSDIPAVAKSLLRRLGTSVGRTRVQLSPAALKFLETTNLPGNVRQLERVLERAIAYSRDRTIRRQTIQDLLADLEDSIARMREERASLERQRLINMLRETGGNITHTADALGKSRAAVYRMITKHQIPLTRRG